MPFAQKILGRGIDIQKRRLEDWRKLEPLEKSRAYHKSLAELVSHAGEHVPYYRDLFRRIRFDTRKLWKDIAWINEIPHLTKESVIRQPKQFIADTCNRTKLIGKKSSGSTGLTLSFYYSMRDLDVASAALRLLDETAGRTLAQNEVHLRLLPPSFRSRSLKEIISEACKNVLLNRRVIEFNALTPKNADLIMNKLVNARFFSLYGLRSTFEAILRLSLSSTQPKPLCSVFINSGETLNDESAKYISQRAQCQVVNRYGSAEFGAVAQSTNSVQSQRFLDGLVFPENLKVGGGDEIVLTTLFNRSMPLIRYRTGDLGEVNSDDFGGFVLENIQGRLHDVIDLKSGVYTTAYLSHLLQANFDIHDFQVYEPRSDEALEFRIVTDAPAQLSQIADHLERHLRRSVKVVRIRSSDLVRRGQQMKYSHVVRN